MEVFFVPLLVGVPVFIVVGIIIFCFAWVLDRMTVERQEKLAVALIFCAFSWVFGTVFLAVLRDVTGITILGVLSK